MSARALYYKPGKPSAFSSVNKLSAALSTKKSEVKAWLEEQDAYIKHRPDRKRFVGNPYTVSNLMEVWECDPLDVQSLAKYNDIHRCILSVIDVFSKYLHLAPAKTKSGPSIPSGLDPYFMTMIRAYLCGYVQRRAKISK